MRILRHLLAAMALFTVTVTLAAGVGMWLTFRDLDNPKVWDWRID